MNLEHVVRALSKKYNFDYEGAVAFLSSMPKSKNAECLEKWKNSGKSIPICVNKGCKREVAIRHWSAQGHPSLKTECSKCSSHRIKGKTLTGIVFHKKKYCENKEIL